MVVVRRCKGRCVCVWGGGGHCVGMGRLKVCGGDGGGEV